MLATFFELR